MSSRSVRFTRQEAERLIGKSLRVKVAMPDAPAGSFGRVIATDPMPSGEHDQYDVVVQVRGGPRVWVDKSVFESNLERL